MNEFLKILISILIGYGFIKILSGSCNDFHVINM